MSAGGNPPSPASPTFEDAREDFQAFLSQSKNYQGEMTENMEFEDESRKRPLPSSTEEEEAVGSVANNKSSKKRQVNSSTTSSTSKKSGKQAQTGTVKTNMKGEVIPPIKNQGSKSGSSESTTLYGAYTKAPFIVLFRIPTTKDQPRKRFSMITMAKKLMSANVKYDSVAPSSFNTWRVTFPSKAAANMALRNKFIKDEGFITYIPKYKLTRQFVIRNIPLDLSLAELKTVIEEENQDILISDLFRLKRRDRTTGIWSDSEAVCVQKLGEELPDHIKVYRTIVHTSPFQRSVRLCFNCGLFGHLSKFCEKNPRCLQCGSEDHVSSKETPCSEPKKCINCEEEHATSDRKCPKFMKNLEIAKAIAVDNLPFMEARALVQKRENKNCPFYEDRRPPVFSSRNFPLLPSRGGVSTSNFATSLQSSSRGRTFAASLMKVAPEISSKLLEIMEKASTMKQLDQLVTRLEKTMKLHEETIKK